MPRAWETPKTPLMEPEQDSLLDAWRRNQIPPDVLNQAGVPPYEEWRQTYEPSPAPEPVPPREPSLWERLGEGYKKIAPTLEKFIPTPQEWLTQGPAAATTKPVLGALELYGEKVAKPVAEAVTKPLWEKEAPTYEEWEAPGVELPWTSPFTKEKARISLKTPAEELAFIPLWVIPVGKAGQAERITAKLIAEGGGRKAITDALSKIGFKGDIDKLIVNTSKKVNEQLAKKAPKAAEGAGAKLTKQIDNLTDQLDNVSEAILKADDAGRLTTKLEAKSAAIEEKIGKLEEKLAALPEGAFPTVERVPLRDRLEALIADKERVLSGASGDLRTKLERDIAVLKQQLAVSPAPKAAEAMPPVSGAIPPKPPVSPPPTAAVPPAESALDKLRRVLSEAKPLGKQSEEMIAAERKRRTAAAISAEKAAGGGEKGLYAGLAKAKGAMERPEFEAVRGKFTPDEIDDLIRMPDSFLNPDGTPLRYWERVTTKQGFLKLMEGKIPEPKELEWLEKVYGEEIVTAVVKSIKTGAWTKILDVLGIPRALQTSLDLSYWLRQGGPLALRHPKRAIKNLGEGAKSFIKDKNAKTLDETVRTNPWYELATSMERPEAARLFLPQWGSKAMKLAQRQEEFMTSAFGKKFAKYLGLTQSERAFVTGLNKMKMDEFAYLMEKAKRLGLDTDKLAGPTAAYLNILTGRGNLGRQLNSIAPILNQMFYSARLQVSRLQLGPFIIKRALKGSKTPEETFLLKEMVKTMAAWVGLTMGFLTAGVVIGGGTVEEDPRSTDGGKLRLGNTRLDPWGGHQQWFRFFIQLITGTRKETATGGVKEINRGDLVERFIRGKFSPQLGFLADLLFDQTVIGEEMTASWEGVGQQLRNRLLAFTIMDMLDAIEQEGIIGGLYAAPSLVGYGVVSYADPLIEREGRLGEIDEDGNMYSLSTFGGDVNRYSGVGGKEGTPLVKFYFESSKAWDKYYDLSIGDARDKFRMSNPRTEAMMYFWGKFTVMQNPKSEKYLKEFIDKHGIHESWIPGLRKETEAPTTTPTPAPGRKRAWDTEPVAPTGRKRAWD